MSAKKSGGPLIGDNRKARHIYEYLETIEAGISLTGPEVKSLRAGQVNFTDSYVEFRRGEAWLIGLHIAPYTNAGYVEQNADRPRKLLMHAQEIASFAAKVEQKGLTIVPAKLYLKHGKIKVELALGRGRKLHDHRVELKRRAETRDMQRITAPSGSMTGRDAFGALRQRRRRLGKPRSFLAKGKIRMPWAVLLDSVRAIPYRDSRCYGDLWGCSSAGRAQRSHR